jgi:hypothetical protein
MIAKPNIHQGQWLYNSALCAKGGRDYLLRFAVCPESGLRVERSILTERRQSAGGCSSPATDEGPNGPPQGG